MCMMTNSPLAALMICFVCLLTCDVHHVVRILRGFECLFVDHKIETELSLKPYQRQEFGRLSTCEMILSKAASRVAAIL